MAANGPPVCPAPQHARPAGLSRRGLLRLGALGVAALGAGGAPAALPAAGALPVRGVPASGESLPVLGLALGPEAAATDPVVRGSVAAVLQTFFAAGGRVLALPDPAAAGVLKALPEPVPATQPWLAVHLPAGAADDAAALARYLARWPGRPPALLLAPAGPDWRRHLATLREEQAAGHVGAVGLSGSGPAGLAWLVTAMDAGPLDVVHCPFSLQQREAERRLLPLAAERGTAVLAARPFAGGALFRAVRGQEPPGWTRAFGARRWADVFLRFVLAHPAVTCALVPARRPAALREALAAARGPWPTVGQRRRLIATWQGR